MSCCGKFRQTYAGPPEAPKGDRHAARPRPRTSVIFEYIGQTSLTVIGPVSGRRYRFDGPGARVAVVPSDGAGMARVPLLRPHMPVG